MSIEEYLLFEESARGKHELVNGYVFAMTGGTLAHNAIAGNVFSMLQSQLKGSGCRVYIADVKIKVDETNSVYYPDVLVDCGHYKKSSVYSNSPAVIVEVLSPSTAAIDRREKLAAYKCIPGLFAYVIVQQSRKHVEVHLRDDDSSWTISHFEAGDTVELHIGYDNRLMLAVDGIYFETGIDDGPNLIVREETDALTW